MKITNPFLQKLCGLYGAAGVRGLMSTLEYKGAFYDPATDPVHAGQDPKIYIFWHEYILLPLYLRGHCNLTMLLSQHRDAEVLSRVAHHMGFDCVRGASYR